jgi:hypothetical protein
VMLLCQSLRLGVQEKGIMAFLHSQSHAGSQFFMM